MTVSQETLYNNIIPFGLLEHHHPEVAQALIDSGGPWEFYSDDEWSTAGCSPDYDAHCRGMAFRLKRPEPPMTTDEFIALAVQRLNGWNAVKAWAKGNYDEARRLIGYTPEGGE